MSASPLNPVTIVHKANQRAPLSPGQRAYLKIIKQVGYFLLTTLLTQAPQLAQVVSGKQPAMVTALVAQIVAGVLQIILTGVDKYWSAQGDANYTLVKNTVLETLYAAFRQVNTSSGGSSNSGSSGSGAPVETVTSPPQPQNTGSPVTVQTQTVLH